MIIDELALGSLREWKPILGLLSDLPNTPVEAPPATAISSTPMPSLSTARRV
jgi:hypothetical protein